MAPLTPAPSPLEGLCVTHTSGAGAGGSRKKNTVRFGVAAKPPHQTEQY